jgi:hypothetical protein
MHQSFVMSELCRPVLTRCAQMQPDGIDPAAASSTLRSLCIDAFLHLCGLSA